MTFVALLTKELRLRLRRERTIWVIIIYLLVMSSLGFLYITRTNSYNAYSLSSLGTGLYTLLAFLQLSLILFITPAFTTTSINGEKERQTFDLLLCSRLSSFTLITGKLVAGLTNAFLLIAASVPLFSLVFFFGGVGPDQVLNAALVFIVTAIVVGAFGLFCSTLLKRPPVSTAVTYMLCVVWTLLPWVLAALLNLNSPLTGNTQVSYLFLGNPLLALYSTLDFVSGLSFNFFGHAILSWNSYLVVNLLLTLVLILASMWLVKPNPVGRMSRWMEKRPARTKKVAIVDGQ